jgi:hypothetical protein
MHPLQSKCLRHGRRAALSITVWSGLAVCLAPDAQAQERLRSDVLRQFGGLYAADCQKADAARLRILPNALIVQGAGKRITGRKPQAAYSYYGKVSPPLFKVGLMSRVTDGGTLDFVVFQDKRGPYVQVIGDAAVQTLLGKTLSGARYRRCDADPASTPRTAATARLPFPAQDEPVSDAEKMLGDPQFRAAYLRALGPLRAERWLARLEGPRPPTRQVRLEGVDYTVIALCKAHECADHNTAILYAPQGPAEEPVVYAKVLQQGRTTLIGAPTPTIAASLDQIWAAEWRRR